MSDLAPIFIQEGMLIAIIIFIQLYVFYGTYFKIRSFKRIIPSEPRSNCSVFNYEIPSSDLQEQSPDFIINNLNQYAGLSTVIEDGEEKGYEISEAALPISDSDAETLSEEAPSYQKAKNRIEVPIITSRSNNSQVFANILHSLNTYLIRNKGSVADFNLVKDIVERNTDAEDNDIRITMPIPLYLGLMGTMLGIVIGLFNMPDLGADLFQGAENTLNESEAKSFSDGMNILLGGVKIAMIASFVGLLLTTVNSGFFYKGSKALLENRKNEFYTFLQTELLPILSQNDVSGMHLLQQNFIEFNMEFNDNLEELKDLVEKNHHTIQNQYKILQLLEDSDFTNLIKANINSFDKIQNSIAQLERSSDNISKFNDYLQQVNSFVEQSKELNNGLLGILSRTNNIQSIAQKVEHSIDSSNNLQHFLSSHFSELENRGQLINNAVGNVDKVLNDSLDELRQSMTQQIQSFKEYSLKEQSSIEKMLTQNAESTKAFLTDTQKNLASSIEQNTTNLENFINEVKSRMNARLTENETAIQKLEHLEALNQNFENFMNQQQEFNKKIGTGLLPLTGNADRQLQTTNAAQLSKENKFKNWLNLIFQITAIIFFITLLVFFLIDRFF
jgi:hypothetical protein